MAAFAAGVAGVFAWFGKTALAAPTPPPITPVPSPPPVLPGPDGATIEDLKKRVAALEATLANQAAFTKDASGNLTLRANGHVHVHAGGNVQVQSSGAATVASSGVMTLKGSTINLN